MTPKAHSERGGRLSLARFVSPHRSPLEPSRIRALTFSGGDNLPSASPDGRVIAFVSVRDGPLEDLAQG